MLDLKGLSGAWPGALFAALAVLTVYFELFSAMEIAATFPWARIQHFLLFLTLAGVAAIAFPRTPVPVIGLGLAAFGAGLELLEMRDILDRTFNVMDWAAEIAGVAASLGAATLLRGRLASRHYRRLMVEPASPLVIELLFIAVGLLGLLAVMMQS